jgi:hypothetical protein
MEYFKELDWNYNIVATGPTIKNWCTEEKANYGYFQIPIERLCDNFEVYKLLRDKLSSQGLILYKAKFMQMDPFRFMKIHVDQGVQRPDLPAGALHYYDNTNAMSYSNVATPIEVALNIPLLNGKDHITRWYEATGCDVNLQAAPCGPLPTIDLENWPDLDDLVAQRGVAEHRLSKPSLIRTSVLHNVDARHSKRMRWIMSFRITDASTRTFINWNDIPRLQAIQF